MPIYEFQDPDSGLTIEVEGDSQPTDADLEPLFRQAYQQKSEQLTKKAGRLGAFENVLGGMVPTRWPEIVKENVYDPIAKKVRSAAGLGDVPISTPEETARGLAEPISEKLGLGPAGKGRLTGALEMGVGLVEGLPSAAPVMGLGALGTAGAAMVGSIFASPMVTGSFDQFKAASGADESGNIEEASRLRTQGAISLLMGLGIPAGVPIGKALKSRTELRNALKDRGLSEAEQAHIEDQILKAQDIALDETIPGSAVVIRRPIRIDEPIEHPNVSISEPKEAYWRGVRESPEGGRLGFQRGAEETASTVPEMTRQAFEREKQLPPSPKPLGNDVSLLNESQKVSAELERVAEPTARTPTKLPGTPLPAAETPVVTTRETPAETAAGRAPTPGELGPTSGVVAPEATATAVPISTVKPESQQSPAAEVGAKPPEPAKPAETAQPTSPAAPGTTPQTKAQAIVQSTGTAAGGQSLGIVPPEVARIQAEVINPIVEYLRPNHPTDAPAPIPIDRNPLPALAPHEFYKQQVTRPEGAGKVPIYGRLHDPRYKGAEPVQQAFITLAFEQKVGDSVAAIQGARFQWADDAFKADPETGRITNVERAEGKSPYLEDIAREFYQDPTSVNINPEQIRALVEARQHMDRLLKLMADEGVPKAEALQAIIEEARYADQPNTYFPRVVTKFPHGEKLPGKAGLSRNPAQLKPRSFKSQAEGVEAGYTYEPLFSNLMATATQRAYRAIAANRLSKDPALGGQTIRERLEAAAEDIFPELKFLKERFESASDPAVQRAFLDKYKDTFEDLRTDYPDRFSELREAVSRVTSREGTVNHPLFQGRIFDAATARALNERLAKVPHKILDAASSVSKVSNTFMLSLDWSAPFVQGQPALWWSIAKRKNVWGRAVKESLKSWADPDYMRRVIEKPENLEAANELAQLGVGLGRLQDYMAGAEKGEFATRLPVVGGAFRRAGGAFGAFLDVAKLEWWKVLREITPRDQWLKTAEAMENLVGSGRSESIGVHPQIAQAEQLAWRAATYYRSGVNVIANLVERGASGDVTREAIGSMLGGITATFVAAALVKGMSWDEIGEKFKRLDFTIPFDLPNGKRVNIGFGHVVMSLLKLGVRLAAHVKGDKAIDAGGAESNPVLRWLWGHAGALPQLAVDSVLGRDYLGQPTSIRKAALKQVTPLPIGQIGQTLQREGTISAIGDAIPTAIGLNAYPESYRQMYRNRVNKIAQSKTGKDYDDLSIVEQSKVVREAKKLKEVVNKPEATMSEISRGLEEAGKRREKLAEMLSPGSKQFLAEHGLKITGYDPEISVNGVSVYLDTARRDAFASLVAQEYDKTIARLGKSSAFQRLPPLEKKKAFDKRLTAAKQDARELLLKRDALEKKKKK